MFFAIPSSKELRNDMRQPSEGGSRRVACSIKYEFNFRTFD
jgi:hypothetical protein